MLEILEELCALGGVSGNEDSVRTYILKKLFGRADCSVDALGNVIVFKEGRQRPRRKLMLGAHMDEVGLIVNAVTPDGYLKFTTVGGLDPRVLLGRGVLVGSERLPGVVGAKPIHLLRGEERSRSPQVEEMYIDIGAADEEEAKSHVSIGSYAVFDSDFVRFGDGFIKSKALDDRFGCALMLDMLFSDLEYDTWFAFHVQEEVGLRGSTVAAYEINPEFAIVLEATTAADLSGVEGEKRVCVLGEGPVVSFMDRSTIYDRPFYDLAFQTAKELSIPCQAKTQVAGGNDAGAIHLSRDGVRTCAVSIPCRYIHTAAGVVKQSDIEHARRLVYRLAEAVQGGAL